MKAHLSPELTETRGLEEPLGEAVVAPVSATDELMHTPFGAKEGPQLLSEVPAAGTSAPAPHFLRADEFIAADYPVPETLLGDDGERLLTQGSLLLIYGDGGAGKSTFAVDGIAHLAAGRNWLGLSVPRPVRFLVVENESGQGLFQQKLAEKVSSWNEGEGQDWIKNVYVYAEPWGQFSFATPETRAHLREFCLAKAIDCVVANPLFGVGGPSAGKPEETGAFVAQLREVGLDSEVGFWILHHVNKAGDVSGDWRRHPDTIIELDRDGDQPRTKLRWVKTRWATTPSETRPVKQLLGWNTEHKGFDLLDVDLAGNTVTDTELAERLDEYLAANPSASTKAVYEGVRGDNTRLRKLLEQDGKYACQKGRRGANLWALASEVDTTSLFGETTTSDQVEETAHE